MSKRKDKPAIPVLKAVVVGDCGVGKSCALERLVRDTTREIYTFRQEYTPTAAADLKRRVLDVHGVQIKLQMWELSGNPHDRCFAPPAFKNASAVFVFYDTTRPKTYEHIKNWLEEVEVNRAATRTKANLVIAIIGSKADAPESEYQATDTVEIDGRIFPHFIVSTKTGHGLEEMFEAVIVMALEKMGVKVPRNQSGIVKLRRASNPQIPSSSVPIQPTLQAFPAKKLKAVKSSGNVLISRSSVKQSASQSRNRNASIHEVPISGDGTTRRSSDIFDEKLWGVPLSPPEKMTDPASLAAAATSIQRVVRGYQTRQLVGKIIASYDDREVIPPFSPTDARRFLESGVSLYEWNADTQVPEMRLLSLVKATNQLQLAHMETTHLADVAFLVEPGRPRRASECHSTPLVEVHPSVMAQRKRTKSQISFRPRASSVTARRFDVANIAQIRAGADCSAVFKRMERGTVDPAVIFCIVGLDFSLSLETSNVGQCELLVGALRALVEEVVPVAEQARRAKSSWAKDRYTCLMRGICYHMDRSAARAMEARLVQGIKVLRFNSRGSVQERILWLDKATKRLFISKRKAEEDAGSGGGAGGDRSLESRLRRAQSFFFHARDAFHRRLHDVSTVKGIDVHDIAEIRPGTQGWPDITTREIAVRCLSIIGSERTFRIQLASRRERDSLWIGLQVYVRSQNPEVLLY